MTNINGVIARVDAVKLNTYTEEEKARWLIELDGRIFREIMRGFGPLPPEKYPQDAEKELLVPSPYDVLYDYYLFAMIDFHNREVENYENSYAMFNDKYNDFAKAWQRTHVPPHSGGFNTMGRAPGCGTVSESEIEEKINNHDLAEGSHPFLLRIIKQRYDALQLLIEQYKALCDGAATDADISEAVATHQNSIFAHKGLFDKLREELLNDMQEQINGHAASKNNPHGVTAAQIGAYTKGEIDAIIGKIGTALDSAIAVADAYIDGAGIDTDGAGTGAYVTLAAFTAHVNDTAAAFVAHVNDKANPHNVVAEQIGAVVDLTGYATEEYVDTSIQKSVLDSWEAEI